MVHVLPLHKDCADFEAAAMVQELLRRGGVVPAAQAKEGVPPQRRKSTTIPQEPEPE